ncbi:hypothetical protein D3C71_1260030 [compost metagenome]
MRDALPLQRQRLWKNRRRVHRVDQIDRAVERRLPVTPLGHAGNEFHQPPLASIGIADQPRIPLQHALAHNCVMRAAHRVQLDAQIADGSGTSAQPGKQCGVGGFVMQPIRGQAKTQAGSKHVRARSKRENNGTSDDTVSAPLIADLLREPQRRLRY